MWKCARVFGLLALCVLAASVAKASPIALTNADFSSSLSGWTTFTTANGSLGPSPLPTTASFDVTGGGASDAAEFQVGQITFDLGVQEGGGIFQSFTSGAGSLSLTADIAAFNDNDSQNGAGGIFTLLLDGVGVSTVDFGAIDGHTTQRSTLSALVDVAAGTHEIRFLMTRAFQNGGVLGVTPFQYIDNVSLDLEPSTGPVPEPASLTLLGLGLAGMGARRWRQRKT